MKVISFSDNEVNELLLYYQKELVKTQDRLKYVQEMIKKLNHNIETNTPIVEKEPENKIVEEKTIIKKVEIPEKIIITEVPKKEIEKPEKQIKETPKKSEEDPSEKIVIDLSKINLYNFLVAALEKKDCLLTNADFVEMAIDSYRLKEIPKIDVSRKIATAMMKLVNNKEVMKTRIPGNQNFYYALPDWFDQDQKLKEKYLIS